MSTYRLQLIRDCAVIFALSLACGFAHITFFADPLSAVYADMRGYIERALMLVHAPGAVPFEAFYPPGTHYFFSLFFYFFSVPKALWLIPIVQIILISFANVFSYVLARELFGSRVVVLTLSLLLAIYLPRNAMLSFYLSEPLFIFLITLAQLLFLLSARRTSSHSRLYLLGLLFGCAVLVKGQALAFLLAPISLLLFKQFKHIRRYMPAFFAGIILPILCVSFVNSEIVKKPTFSIAANDTFNMYLGQTQRAGIGCFNKQDNTFYFFHNNNSYFNKHLGPPKIIHTSILDRERFRDATIDLWLEQPMVQLIRSLHNIRELFLPVLYWPVRGDRVLEAPSKLILEISYLCIGPLALWSLLLCVTRRQWLWQQSYLLAPLFGIAGMVSISMGQPRYLVPFHHLILISSVPVFVAGMKNLWGVSRA